MAPFDAAAFDWLPHAAVAYDGASGRLGFNRRARDAFGALLDGVTLETFAGRCRLRSEQGTALLTEDLPLQRALEGEQVRDQRIQIGRPDTGIQVVSVCADPVYETNGKVCGAVMVMLTPTRAAGASESEHRLSNAVGSMAEAMALVRARDGRIAYTNPAWDSLFGYGRGELAGEHMSVVEAPPEERVPGKRLREIVERLDHGQVWRGELEHMSKDGGRFRWQTSIARLDDDEQPLWIVVPTNGGPPHR
jgi:PAS domain S-box-containing protein